jgi:hypothetical protein
MDRLHSNRQSSHENEGSISTRPFLSSEDDNYCAYTPPLAAGSLRISPLQAVELQDQLLSASTELERLTQLIDDAALRLMQKFAAAQNSLDMMTPHSESLDDLKQVIDQAVIALQFHDMSAQLIGHVHKRVSSVVDFLGASLEDGEEPALPVEFVNRACPVAQREMDAGSVELF